MILQRHKGPMSQAMKKKMLDREIGFPELPEKGEGEGTMFPERVLLLGTISRFACGNSYRLGTAIVITSDGDKVVCFT